MEEREENSLTSLEHEIFGKMHEIESRPVDPYIGLNF